MIFISYWKDFKEDLIPYWEDFKEGASWWDPRGPYFFIRDPTPENLAKAIFPYAATTTSAYYFVRLVDPVSMRGVGVREFSRSLMMHTMDMRFKAARAYGAAAARFAPHILWGAAAYSTLPVKDGKTDFESTSQYKAMSFATTVGVDLLGWDIGSLQFGQDQ